VQRRHLIICAVLTAVIIAGLGAAGLIWRRQERAALANAGVARVPDLSRWPAELPQQIARESAAVRAAGSPVAPLARLAGLYWANGFAAEAEQAVAALRRLEPRDAHYAYWWADLRLRAGDQAGAEQALQETVERDGTYAPAWLRWGELLDKRGAADQAKGCFARAVAVAPGSLRAQHDALVFEAQHGGVGESTRLRAAELTRAHPGVREFHELLAGLLTAARDPAGAERERRRAVQCEISLSSEDPWVDSLTEYCVDSNRLVVRALEMRREGRFEETEKLLKKVVQLAPLAPADPIPWDLLANFYLKMDRPAEARATLEKAVAEFPAEPQMPLLLVRLLCAEHEPAAAVAVGRRAVGHWPERADLHSALGLALRDAGDFVAAETALREAIRLDPTLTEAQCNLGTCLFELGRRDEGRAWLEKALAMRPEYPEALYELGKAELEAGNLAAAESRVSKLYSLDPEDPNARRLLAAWHLVRGVAAAQAGDLDEADRQYRAGLEVAPDCGALLREAGALALRRDRWADAVAAFEHYLRVEPADPQGYALLGRALQKAGRPADANAILQRGLSAAQKAGDQARLEELQGLLGR
jgi:tetratricopeptide (TPR) repeat protein